MAVASETQRDICGRVTVLLLPYITRYDHVWREVRRRAAGQLCCSDTYPIYSFPRGNSCQLVLRLVPQSILFLIIRWPALLHGYISATLALKTFFLVPVNLAYHIPLLRAILVGSRSKTPLSP